MRKLGLAFLTAASAIEISCHPERVALPTRHVQRLDDHQHGGVGNHWVGTWAASLQRQRNGFGVLPPPTQFLAQTTLRQIVHTSIGGHQVRIQFSNQFGDEPLVIAAAHIALRSAGASIVPETDRTLTFGGEPVIAIQPQESALSDAVDLDVPPLSDLAISLYLPHATVGWTVRPNALQTNYTAPPGGDYTDATDLPSPSNFSERSWFFLAAVHVDAPEHRAAIVVFGNSITTGNTSTSDSNRRFPDVLAARLSADPDLQRVAVLNAGISGNRLLHDRLGPNALLRFDEDVLAQPGVKYVIVELGANDIFLVGGSAPPSEAVTAEQVISAYQELIDRAHARGLLIFGITLGPLGGTQGYTAEGEAKRQVCNAWIRDSGGFDAVIVLDEILRDPGNPTWMLPAYRSPDPFGHPNDAGYKALADAIPLWLFR